MPARGRGGIRAFFTGREDFRLSEPGRWLLVWCLWVTSTGPGVLAGDIYWAGRAGSGLDWSTPANWAGNSEPTAHDKAYVGCMYGNPGSAIIIRKNEACQNLFVGWPRSDGIVTMRSGQLTTDGLYVSGGSGAMGKFIQDDGLLVTKESSIGHYGREGVLAQFGGTHRIQGSLWVGRGSGTGTYELHDGHVRAEGTYIGYGMYSPVGTFLQTGGRMNTKSLLVGGDTGIGSCQLDGGTLTVEGDECIGLGVSHASSFTQTGGRHQIDHDLQIGAGTSGKGNYLLEGGRLSVGDDLQIGSGRDHSIRGSMTQTGGNIHVAGNLDLGYGTLGMDHASTDHVGTYNLYDGKLTMTRGDNASIRMGRRGAAATLVLGDAAHTPRIAEAGKGRGVDLVVRAADDFDSTAVVRGCGTIGLTGRLTNNGQIIADGYGTDRVLDLSTFTACENDIDNGPPPSPWFRNTDTNGWFAVNKGRLVLPDLTVASGSSAVNWGEDPNDTGIDLVNSLRLSFAGVRSKSRLSVSLLSPDRIELTLPDDEPFIGIWELDADRLRFSSMNLMFRYDDILARQLGLAEADLKVFRSPDGVTWTPIGGSVNVADHTLLVSDLTGLSYYAVGAPEPATLVLVLMGLLGLLWRWRTR